MDHAGLVAEIDLSYKGVKASSPAAVSTAKKAAAATMRVSGDATPSRASRGRSPFPGGASLLRETDVALSSRRNALMSLFRSTSFQTNVPLYTAMTVSGHATLFATAAPVLTVSFMPEATLRTLHEDSEDEEAEETGLITIGTRVVYRWGAPMASPLDGYACIDPGAVDGVAKSPSKAPPSSRRGSAGSSSSSAAAVPPRGSKGGVGGPRGAAAGKSAAAVARSASLDEFAASFALSA